jgi:hypothetical protein
VIDFETEVYLFASVRDGSASNTLQPSCFLLERDIYIYLCAAGISTRYLLGLTVRTILYTVFFGCIMI